MGNPDWGFSVWAHNADYLVVEVDIPGVGKRYRLARPNGDAEPLPPEFAKLEGKSPEDLLTQYNTIAPRFGKYVRRVDDFKHPLEPDHVKAALREKNGEIVKINPKTGKPYDHLTETRNAMSGAKARIALLKKYLSDPDLSPKLRSDIEAELGELSKMLDNAEKILGESAK